MIEGGFYLILTIILLYTSMRLYKFSMKASIFNLNIVNFSYWILLLVAVIPSLITIMQIPLFGHDPIKVPGILNEWGDRNNHIKAYLIIMWGMFAIPIGAILGKLVYIKFFNKVPVNISTIQTDYLINGCEKNRDRNISILFIIISLVLLFQSFLYGQSPLMIILKGGGLEEILLTRQEFSQSMGFFHTLFNSDTVAFFMIFSGILAYRFKSNFYWFIFIIQFIIYASLSILAGSTGNLVFGIASILILKNLITGKNPSIYSIVIIAFIVFGVFYIFKAQQIESLQEIIDYFGSRVIFTQIRGFYWALQLFPDEIPFLYFDTSAHWIHEIFGSKISMDYGHLLMYEFDPRGVDAGVAGHFTSVFYTEMWSNFGIYGVIFGPIWVGIILFVVHSLLVRTSMSNLRLSIYVWLTFNGFGYLDAFIIYFYPVNILAKIAGIFMAYSLVLLIGALLNKSKLVLNSK